MMTNKEYSEKVGLAHRKKFAQFFTPENVADFMAKWVLTGYCGRRDILDPAFGLGVFCRSLLKRNKDIKVTGYDIDQKITEVAQMEFSELKDTVTIRRQDYLTSSWSDKYDGVICNPPYLKFHDYDNTFYVADVNAHLGTKLNGFTNIYTLFLLKSIAQLKHGGRLAYVIPSEFLNSDYGVAVKQALLQSNTLKHVIIVDFKECAFDDALTTASILLCERNGRKDEVKFSVVNEIEGLDDSLLNSSAIHPDNLDAGVKWKQYYEQTSASKYQHLVPFSKFAKVSRGIATGANNYFTFKRSRLDDFNIEERCTIPCICHAIDVATPIFTHDDFLALARADKNVYLFNGRADERNEHVKAYLELGIRQGIDKRYLTASRHPWYALEHRPPAPIWVSVFNRNGLRFVRNEAGVHNLTTFHCVYTTGTIDTDVLFAYLLTGVAKQIFLDNSRQYGNGLVKFEPNDLNNGQVLDLTLLTEQEIAHISKLYASMRKRPEDFGRLVEKLDSFFRRKYTGQPYDFEQLTSDLPAASVEIEVNTKRAQKNSPRRIRQLNLFE